VLTTVYAVGQILGPLIAAPPMDRGHTAALLLSCAIVIAAAIAAGLLRMRNPHNLDQPRMPLALRGGVTRGLRDNETNEDRRANR